MMSNIFKFIELCVRVVKKVKGVFSMKKRLQLLSLRAKEVKRWFMSIRESFMEKSTSVGTKVEEWVGSLPLYIPYNMNDCSISRFLDCTLDGKDKKIIRKGFTTKKKRLELISNLSEEFMKAQECEHYAIDLDNRAELLRVIIEIERLQLARLMAVRGFESSRKILKDLGIDILFKSPNDKYIKIIDSQISIRSERKRTLESKIKKEENGKMMTRQDYVDILIRLGVSTEVGYKTDLSLSLAEFASLLKLNKEKVKQYEQIKKRHHRK